MRRSTLSASASSMSSSSLMHSVEDSKRLLLQATIKLCLEKLTEMQKNIDRGCSNAPEIYKQCCEKTFSLLGALDRAGASYKDTRDVFLEIVTLRLDHMFNVAYPAASAQGQMECFSNTARALGYITNEAEEVTSSAEHRFASDRPSEVFSLRGIEVTAFSGNRVFFSAEVPFAQSAEDEEKDESSGFSLCGCLGRWFR